MKRLATILATLALLTLWQTAPVSAQTTQPVDVTVRQINTIHPDSLQLLQDLGATLTQGRLEQLIRSPYAFQRVRFEAVVVSNPLNSGLSSVSGGRPSRIHIFVRDITAAEEGNEGHGIQIVDGDYETTGTRDLFPGDVIRIVGRVNYFGNTLQLDNVNVEVLGDYIDFDLPESIIEPVVVTTTDIQKNVAPQGEPSRIQANWENFNSLSGQFVRIENARVQFSDDRTGSRPNWVVSSDNGETLLLIDDMSLRFRNDKGDYPATFNVRDANNPFIGPPIGAVINLEGFVLLRGGFDPFSFGSPGAAMFRIAPWEDAHLEILEQPPISVVTVNPVPGIPGDAPVNITITVGAEDPNEIAAARMYYRVGAGTEQQLSMTAIADDPQGNRRFQATIPAQANDVFVTVRAQAQDTGGRWYDSEAPYTYRVLHDGITRISHVRRTATGQRGPSVFNNQTVDMNIVARVQTDPDSTNMIILQDNENLDPWSGIWVVSTAGLRADLNRGDVINITRASIDHNFGLTRFTSLTYTRVGTEEPYPHKVIPSTQAFQDPSVAEAHVGMLVRFNNVTVTNVNPDAPSQFGEFLFASQGTTFGVRADDQSAGIPLNINDSLRVNQTLPFIQGAFTYTFNNYKVLPEVLTDIGNYVVNTEDDLSLPGTFALEQNYPNPFNPSTLISYEVAAAGQVRLEVFDMLGRRVATLVDGAMPAGQHQVTFDAHALPSGVYVYRLEAGNRMLTRTMMLVK
jgi:hypothetical protein